MNPPGTVDPASGSLAPRGYGARLRVVREQSGLTIDQVAQQLKLAPRQVKAIEDEDLAVLPEVTYIRGFVRNYARLLRIDAGELVDGLPTNGAEPVQSTTFRRSGTRMAELPTDSASRGSWARWAVPLLLAVAALAFAAYEWFRQERAQPVTQSGADTPLTTAPTSATPAPATAMPSGAPTATPAYEPPAPPAAQNATSAPAASGAESRILLVNPSVVPEGPASAPGAATASSSSPMAAAPAAPEASAPGGEVRLAFVETAWVEVRDGRGRVLLSETSPSGSTRMITGDPPFALVIGNAEKVRVTFNGQPVDIAQHIRANIARLSLR